MPEEDPNKKVSEDALIGVVTPFSAQASVIKAELKRAVLGADPSARLPEHLWEKITVGTAHKLQGAEAGRAVLHRVRRQQPDRSVHRRESRADVAVSRAKDLFIVFASETRWGNGKVFTLMTQYAARSSAVFGCPAQGLVPARRSSSSPQLPSQARTIWPTPRSTNARRRTAIRLQNRRGRSHARR